VTAAPHPFVTAAWLRAHRADPRVRVVDARSMPHGAQVDAPDGRQLYAAGHIPCAVHLDYAEDAHDLATPYAARVAPPERFAEVMAAHGIGDETFVVAYDAGDAPYAARMVWMLRYYGHDDAAILAGGLPAWQTDGGTLATDVPSFARARFTPRPRPALRATRDEVLAVAEGRSDAQLLETQRDGTYAQRDRDIPNAVRLSASDLLEDARGGRIAAPARLEELIAHAGLDRSKRTICSCGSGVGASGAYVALLDAGFTDVAVYDGSWMEWSHDELPTVAKPAGRR
jgi:thiosulfate/3-mercaptopyruvate sulfurtransferase